MPVDVKASKIRNDNFLLYESPILGIKILYPLNWTKTDNSNVQSNPIVKFSPPQGDFSKLFIETNGSGFNNGSLRNYAHQQIDRLSHILTDFKLIESTSTTAGSEKAEKAVYTFMLQNILFKKMEIWLVKDSKVYTINYLAPEIQYANYLPMIERMINSFEIS
jgi:serine/threonine-protein kinase